MFTDCLGKRAEDDAEFAQFVLERGGHRNTVKNRVDRNTGQHFPLLQGHTELLVGAQQFRINVGQTLRPVLARTGRRIIADALIIDRRMMDRRPARFAHGEPMPIRFQPPFQHERRLFLLGRNEADHRFVQANRNGIRIQRRYEPVWVISADQFLKFRGFSEHQVTPSSLPRTRQALSLSSAWLGHP